MAQAFRPTARSWSWSRHPLDHYRATGGVRRRLRRRACAQRAAAARPDASRSNRPGLRRRLADADDRRRLLHHGCAARPLDRGRGRAGFARCQCRNGPSRCSSIRRAGATQTIRSMPPSPPRRSGISPTCTGSATVGVNGRSDRQRHRCRPSRPCGTGTRQPQLRQRAGRSRRAARYRASPESSPPRADNRIGIAGVAPGARLLGLRACWQQGRLSDLRHA